MAGTTTRGVPTVDGTDSADGPAAVNPVATWLNDNPGVATLTTVERDALATAGRWTGRVIFNTTTAQLEHYTGSAWVAVVLTAHGDLTGRDDPNTHFWAMPKTGGRLESFGQRVVSSTATGPTHNIDVGVAVIHDVTLAATTAISLTNAPADAVTVTVFLQQNATGGHGATFPNVRWSDGVAPIVDTLANGLTIVQLIRRRATDAWHGHIAGSAYATVS